MQSFKSEIVEIKDEEAKAVLLDLIVIDLAEQTKERE